MIQKGFILKMYFPYFHMCPDFPVGNMETSTHVFFNEACNYKAEGKSVTIFFLYEILQLLVYPSGKSVSIFPIWNMENSD